MPHYSLSYSLFKFLLATALILWGCGGNSDSTNNIPNDTSDITDNASSSSKETNSILCNEGETLTDGIVTYICSDQKWIQQELTQQCTEGESFTGGSFIYTCFGGQWITQEEPSQTKGSSSSTTNLLENTNSSSSIKAKSSSSNTAKSSSSVKKTSSSSSNTNCKDGESRKIYFDDLYIADVCKNGSWKYPSTSCEKTGPTIVETLETIIINGVSYTSYCYNNTLYFKKTCKEGDRDTITENGVLRARVCSAYGLWTTIIPSSSTSQQSSSSQGASATSSSSISVRTGTFKDNRDGKEYKTVTIGSQTWMAENLNYKGESTNSYCYEDKESYCTKYGRLYVKLGGVQCPIGWHLPNRDEWDILLRLGGNLKSKSGWRNSDTNAYNWDYYNGDNTFYFNVKPGGYRNPDDRNKNIEHYDYNFEGSIAYFWTSDYTGQQDKDYNSKYSLNYVVYFESQSSRGRILERNIAYGFSVRCIKD